MCRRDRHQPPQPASKAVEAGYHLYEHSLNSSTTSSSSSSLPFTSASTSSVSSSSTPTSSVTKKRRWYKPNLRLNLDADWIWVGFIRAGHTTPTGRGPQQSGREDDTEWEQLPAYAPPPEEGIGQQRERVDETRSGELDEWLAEPPSFEPGQGGRDSDGMEPPEYR